VACTKRIPIIPEVRARFVRKGAQCGECTLDKCVGAIEVKYMLSMKNLCPPQKTLRFPWCPKLFTGLVRANMGFAWRRQFFISMLKLCFFLKDYFHKEIQG